MRGGREKGGREKKRKNRGEIKESSGQRSCDTFQQTDLHLSCHDASARVYRERLTEIRLKKKKRGQIGKKTRKK